MSEIIIDEQPTPFTCTACGAGVLLRVERFNSFQGSAVRGRRHVCSVDPGHDVGELRVESRG